MKILVVAFAYNEINYIENMVNYYRKQGCDLDIIDNYSNDGTYEWLMSHDVRTRIKDTGGTFNLLKLQASLVNDIRAIRPDWVVYTGVDIYICFDKTIRKTIEEADAQGYNMIGINYFNMYNTGESFRLPLKDTYFYGRHLGKLYLIAKYTEPFGFEADSIQIKDKKIIVKPGVFLNYGNCKPATEREQTYKRRKRAWDNGLDRNYGVHYLDGHARGWVWNKEELSDLRQTEYYKYIKKLR